MGYKIIKDNVHTKEDEKKYSLVGKEYDDYKGGKHRIRLLDDDGNVYLYMLSDLDYVEGNFYEEQGFAPLDRFMNVYGCTELQYKGKNGEYVQL
ncbi:hypothetical protein IEN91_04790 [Bacillus velezensis]|uniref:hypothetical protein n=1 Tax=Bacillus velezensis TaxID=492670 RepID=UPI0018C5E18F|nr:hypothetical protein [Bacillus velezensis]QPK89761.1 hypothetical protein IEN91_04790 [Bacillus velezensis]